MCNMNLNRFKDHFSFMSNLFLNQQTLSSCTGYSSKLALKRGHINNPNNMALTVCVSLCDLQADFVELFKKLTSGHMYIY